MTDSPIDFDAPPQSLGAERDYAFQMMKKSMVEIYSKTLQHVNPMIRGAKLASYVKGIDDAFQVFAQVVEVPSEEELGGG